MIKKLFSALIIASVLILGLVNSAKAYIDSEDEIQYRIEQLNNLSEVDLSSYIPKGELIGIRQSNFNTANAFYKNTIRVTTDNLTNILNQIRLIKKSAELSDSEKEMQIQKLYGDASAALNDLDTKTFSYLIEIKQGIPTITYDRYSLKFQDLYNSMNLTGNPVYVD